MKANRQTKGASTTAGRTGRRGEEPSDPVIAPRDADARPTKATESLLDPALIQALTFTANGLAG